MTRNLRAARSQVMLVINVKTTEFCRMRRKRFSRRDCNMGSKHYSANPDEQDQYGAY
ncbi:MAG: hypothetical protein JJ890_19195 [Pseudomonadales bacterium]|nr:hypothetical protein [Pseudomonadales bacterium]